MPYRLIAALVALLFVAPSLAAAADAPKTITVRAGKAIATSFPFTVLDIGESAGIWKSVGIDLQIVSFRGDAQLQQGLASGAVDFGLGSGPAMAYHAKGIPAVAVASMMSSPVDMALIVSNRSGITSVGQLKGKKIGVTTAGSLTDWLVHELSRRQGWGSDGIITVPMGATEARIAAMDSGQIDGTAQDASVGYTLEAQRKAKNLVTFGSVVKAFETHVIFARDQVIAQNPDEVTRFLRGWFKTIQYMKTHREQTIDVATKVLGYPRAVVARAYDDDMNAFSTNGTFDQKAIETVRGSLKELGLVETTPDLKSMYTTKFVPVKT